MAITSLTMTDLHCPNNTHYLLFADPLLLRLACPCRHVRLRYFLSRECRVYRGEALGSSRSQLAMPEFWPTRPFVFASEGPRPCRTDCDVQIAGQMSSSTTIEDKP